MIKKIILSAIFSLLALMAITHIYVNMYWPQTRIVSLLEETVQNKTGWHITFSRLSFNIFTGLSLENVHLHRVFSPYILTLDVPSVRLQHEWNNQQRQLSIDCQQPHIVIDHEQHAPAETTSSLPATTPAALSAFDQRISHLMEIVVLSLTEDAHTLNFYINQGTSDLLCFSPQLPSFFRQQWASISGHTSMTLTPFKTSSTYTAQTQSSDFQLSCEQDTTDPTLFIVQSASSDWNTKSTLQWDNSIVHIKSLIGQYKHLKFYSRGDINLLSGDMQLSHILNVSTQSLASYPQFLPPMTGDMDIFLALQGNLFDASQLQLNGSLSSDQILLHNIKIEHLSGDFQYHNGIWTLNPLKAVTDQSKLSGEGTWNTTESDPTCNLNISLQNIAITQLVTLLSPQPIDLKNLSTKSLANTQMDISIPTNHANDLSIKGTTTAQNMVLLNTHPLFQSFQKATRLSIDTAQPNSLATQFHLNRHGLTLSSFTITYPDMSIDVEGSWTREQRQLLLDVVAEDKRSRSYGKGNNTTQKLTLQGSLDNPQWNLVS